MKLVEMNNEFYNEERITRIQPAIRPNMEKKVDRVMMARIIQEVYPIFSFLLPESRRQYSYKEITVGIYNLLKLYYPNADIIFTRTVVTEQHRFLMVKTDDALQGATIVLDSRIPDDVDYCVHIDNYIVAVSGKERYKCVDLANKYIPDLFISKILSMDLLPQVLRD